MNLENKQRIVGIVVLVALIALLIPFLFTSGIKKRHKLALAEEELASPDVIEKALNGSQEAVPDERVAPPDFIEGVVEDVTEKVLPEDSGQQKVAFPETPPVMIMPEQQEAQYLPQQAVPIAEETVEATAVVGTTNGVASFVEEDIGIIEVEPQPQHAIVIEKERPKKAVKVEAKKYVYKPKKKPGMYWSVQVGSFRDENRAENLVNKLQNKGFNVYSQDITTTRGAMVRVLVGREDSRSDASDIAEQLKTRLNLEGLIVRKK